MRVRNSVVIAKREYLSRVKTVGFWVGTVILPVMILAMMLVPTLLVSKLRGTLRVAVVDETERIAPGLLARLTPSQAGDQRAADGAADQPEGPPMGRDRRPEASELVVEVVPMAGDVQTQRAALDARVLAKEIDAWVWISRRGLEQEDQTVEYHGENVSNFVTQERLSNAIERSVRDWRLTEAGYDPKTIASLSRDVDFVTTRVTATGSREEGGLAGFFMAYILFFLLFIMIMIFGAQVLNGVLEEKSSRIVEIIVSTTTPFELMAGKIAGICAVALTQIVIWMGTATVATTPGLIGAASMGFKLPQVPVGLALHFIAFFVIGFVIYASCYAALGAAYNDIKEAQQASSSLAFIIMPPMLLMFPTINNPDSTLSTVASLIPPFTPLLMVLRLAVKPPPLWQVLLGYAGSIAFVVFMIWFCSKIYRVGILMYGKKPTLKELARWVRYA